MVSYRYCGQKSTKASPQAALAPTSVCADVREHGTAGSRRCCGEWEAREKDVGKQGEENPKKCTDCWEVEIKHVKEASWHVLGMKISRSELI